MPWTVSGLFISSGLTPLPSPPYVGPGNVISGAKAWYGLRAYSSATIGSNAVRLREDGGNTEQDFATIAGGGLDLAAISAFKGANNLFVVTLYDQTGNSLDLTQATAAKQPTFTLSGLGSFPVMTFASGSATILSKTGGGLFGGSNIAQPWTVNVVYKRTVQQNTCILAVTKADNSDNAGCVAPAASANTATAYAGVSLNATAADSSWHAFQCVGNGASGDCNIDGTATTGNDGSYTLENGGRIDMGGDIFSEYLSGAIVEGGIWPSGFSSTNSSNMSANQRTYWGF